MRSSIENSLEFKEGSEFTEAIGRPIVSGSLGIKRLFDIVFGVIFLVICSPIILVFGILIKLTSPGPVIFAQERVGFMGKKFKVFKLRSMMQDAEKKTGAVWAQKNDPRVTTIGKFMRRTRVDELPQFWNVICGDMSLVGPRPERPILTQQFYESYPDFAKRLRARPGITGYAQIHGGYEISPEDKSDLDNYYIEHFSFLFDLKILFGTIRVIFTGDGAR